MILWWPNGLKINVSGFAVRCALCRAHFKAGESVTIGADLMAWTHKECWQRINEPLEVLVPAIGFFKIVKNRGII